MASTTRQAGRGVLDHRVAGAPEAADLRAGVVAAWTTTVLTVVSFGLAITALPDHVPYPFATDRIAEQWPGDYWWMYAAMLLMLAFVTMVAAIHRWARPAQQLWSLLGLCAAVLSAAVLLIDYFVQVTVMQPSLEKGQLDGWALFTQYNPNGVFIALEELGYLLTAIALLCLAPVFDGHERVHRALRLLLTGCFALVVVALVAVSAVHGIDRGDDFEIAVISVVWLTLIATGPLIATVMRQAGRSGPGPGPGPGPEEETP